MSSRARSAGALGRALADDARSALRELRAGRREQVHHSPAPPSHGLVADVGGGDRPHPRADVVVEKYVADDFERELGVSTACPLVVADGEALPFADDTFDYVIASHVLEHARSPEAFAAELSRIGRAGFVQVPSRAAELTFGWPFHPWLVDLDGDVLVFEPRDGRTAPCGQLFHDSYRDSVLMRRWWAANRSVWHHSVHWDGALTVRRSGSSQPEASATFDVDGTLAALAALADRLPPLPPAIQAALRCPSCGGTIELAGDAARCLACGSRFPRVGPTPVLLTEAKLA